MSRKKILAWIPGTIFLTIIILVIVVIQAKTKGLPILLHKKNSVDSIHLTSKNRTISISDLNELNKLTTTLSSSKKVKADRTNLNKGLIEVDIYFKSGKETKLLIIENVIHGNLLAIGWIYYKNDDFITSIKKYINQ